MTYGELLQAPAGFDDEALGLQIRAARLALGLTQAAAAKELLTRRETLSRWECGHGLPTLAPFRASVLTFIEKGRRAFAKREAARS